MTPRRAVLAALVAFVAVNLLFLGARPVLTADETRYGSIAAQMAESGDWLLLRMSGFRFYEKPPLTYWMTAASIEAFGRNGFAIRLPAALCGGLAALAVGIAARRGARLAGSAPADAAVAGALVALASLTMVLPAVGSSVAILDQPIAGLTLAAACAYFMAVTGSAGRARAAWLVACGVLAGLAFMTKGLLAVVLPASMLVPWLAWERRWRDLFLTPWVPLAVGALVVLPWAVAVTSAEPGFWTRFIVHEHFQRFTGSGSNQPRESTFFYLLIVPLGCVPWIAAAPLAAAGAVRGVRSQAGLRFALCALVGPFVFLSLSRGKLPTYALPCFAPAAWLIVAGLLAAFGARGDRARSRWADAPGLALLALAATALALALSGDASAGLLGRAWLAHPHAHAAVLAAALALWGIGDLLAQRARTAPARVAWMGLSPVAALASFGLLFPDAALDDALATGPSIERERASIIGTGTLFCDQKLAHASAWFLDRTDFLVVDRPREFANGQGVAEDDARLVPDAAFAGRLAEARATGTAALAAATPIVDRLLRAEGVPEPARRVDFRGWALVEFPRDAPLH
jgi:4-amino-4-deoxy-L-arabinose transferase